MGKQLWISCNTELEKWQKLLNRKPKMIMVTSYKDNLYKMFYRWHLPPARLDSRFLIYLINVRNVIKKQVLINMYVGLVIKLKMFGLKYCTYMAC